MYVYDTLSAFWPNVQIIVWLMTYVWYNNLDIFATIAFQQCKSFRVLYKWKNIRGCKKEQNLVLQSMNMSKLTPFTGGGDE